MPVSHPGAVVITWVSVGLWTACTGKLPVPARVWDRFGWVPSPSSTMVISCHIPASRRSG